MDIQYCYKRGNTLIAFSGGLGYHYEPGSAGYAEIEAHIAKHPEALKPEPAPSEPTAEEIKARRVAEVKARIKELDAQSISHIRAFQIGKQTEDDISELEKIDAESKALKAELKA